MEKALRKQDSQKFQTIIHQGYIDTQAGMQYKYV